VFLVFGRFNALSLLAFFEKNKKELKQLACLERSRKIQSLTQNSTYIKNPISIKKSGLRKTKYNYQTQIINFSKRKL
tara:strand:- start:469 stop:699 length:231 start_codon:yes stop_codon:yes gene_type:complete